ncbi:transcriptional regulator, LysR family [Pelagibacterium halotolerans B2]|uniref:Transcriptional regulator, LysR family n=1 Tax=Pelagibacterium halotolerans (strain DSM 22347 / JCM 15775 / CGMCC 1.7692 / B2) TaxID=1082931 RepID=G4REP9_PELHB|nr:LysR family transcriptional regulator [Pelagibacterium halotolerans]AEQ50899.1 transcriptional regulator, LysR family [Pelagibacterium halotolerans B2]
MASSFVHVHLVALRYFGETVRTGSMRQAAEHLNVAASAVNRQILKLEDQLQCKLFDRRAEGVRLTAAGEVLYNYILRLERDLDRAISQIDDLRGLRRGHVKIACEDGLGRDYLPPLLSQFHKDHPGITYSVEIASALDILTQVADGAIDIGIAMAPPRNPDVSIIAQAAMPMGVVVAPDSPLAGRQSVRLRDLAGETVILAKDGTGGGASYYEQLGFAQPHTRFMQTNAPDFITNLVKAGLGVGIRSPIGIMGDIEDRKICFVPIGDTTLEAPTLSLYAKPHRALPMAAATLLERLKDALPEFRDRVHAAGRCPLVIDPQREVAPA